VIPLHDNVPTRSFPIVTALLIAANFAVWIFYQLPDLNDSVLDLGYQPCEVNGSCPRGAAVGESWEITSFTAMFLHGSWLHILGNMLFLWIFGNNVEDSLGRVRFLLFYLLAGYAATALQTVVTLAAGTAEDGAIPNVGASGAISGVLGAYLLLLPGATVISIVFFFLVPIPAFLFLGFWFVFQLYEGSFSLVQPQAGGGVAFFAHVGGFAFGLATVRLWMTRPPLRPTY
jgi:membrane associated rhomboid family serine protease